jgi:formylmethanofuran dehydrogenase subunit E
MSEQHPPEPFPLPTAEQIAKAIQCRECGKTIKNATYVVRGGVIYCDECANAESHH